MSKKKPTTSKKSESAKSNTKAVRAKKKELPGDDMFDKWRIKLEDVQSERSQLWDNIQVVGYYLSLGNAPTTAEEMIDLGLIEDEDRIEELENGASLTEEEIELCEKKWIDRYFSGECPTSFGLVKVQGRIVTLFSNGHSFEGISVMVRGISDSWEEALDDLDGTGVRDSTYVLDSDLQKSLGKYES